MAKHQDIFGIPSGIDKSVVKVILNQLKDLKLEPAKVNNLDKQIRNSEVSWLATDHWVSGMLSHFINCANVNSFEFDLHYWADYIQYTVYKGKGTGYGWHSDLSKSAFFQDQVRKLSVSLCLSSKDDYEGGELQVIVNKEVSTFKMDCGDVIIFPSDSMHRVRPLKSGKRISLVGWYGGPKFK